MDKEIEAKFIIHYNDGYFGRIEIGNYADVPETATTIKVIEDDKVVTDFLISDELIPDFIRCLEHYLKTKKEIKQ